MDVREFQIWWNDFMQLATLSDIFRITELYSFINFNGNCSCWTSCTLDIASTVTGFSSICLVSPLSPYRVPFQIFLSLTAYICLNKGCNILIIPANLIAELNNFRKKIIERQQWYFVLTVSQAEIHVSIGIQPHPIPWDFDFWHSHITSLRFPSQSCILNAVGPFPILSHDLLPDPAKSINVFYKC